MERSIWYILVAGLLAFSSRPGDVVVLAEEQNTAAVDEEAAKGLRFRTEGTIVKTEKGLHFMVPEDWPVEKRDGIVIPVPVDEYVQAKFKLIEARLKTIEERLDAPGQQDQKTDGQGKDILSSVDQQSLIRLIDERLEIVEHEFKTAEGDIAGQKEANFTLAGELNEIEKKIKDLESQVTQIRSEIEEEKAGSSQEQVPQYDFPKQ